MPIDAHRPRFPYRWIEPFWSPGDRGNFSLLPAAASKRQGWTAWMRRTAAPALLALCASACATGSATPEPGTSPASPASANAQQEEAAATPAPPQLEAQPTPTEGTIDDQPRAAQPEEGQGPTTVRGTIQRAELEAFVRQGAQAFIRQVHVRPTFRRGAFWGWRVFAYQGPGPIRKGDVVRRINGKSVERPEQFMGVWNQLLDRDQLVVQLSRNNTPLVLRYQIVQ